MNLVDLIIMIIIISILGAIIYFNFIKRDRDMCKSCPYKKENCDCGNKPEK